MVLTKRSSARQEVARPQYPRGGDTHREHDDDDDDDEFIQCRLRDIH